jgi:hypothetical protein
MKRARMLCELYSFPGFSAAAQLKGVFEMIYSLYARHEVFHQERGGRSLTDGIGTLINRFPLRKGYDCAYDRHLALALRNWALDLFPYPLDPSFLLYPLDRDETLLLLMRAIIPRKVLNLWIAMGLVTRSQLPARPD